MCQGWVVQANFRPLHDERAVTPSSSLAQLLLLLWLQLMPIAALRVQLLLLLLRVMLTMWLIALLVVVLLTVVR